MKRTIIYFLMLILIFINFTILYMNYPYIFSSTDEKLSSYFLKLQKPAPASKKITIIDIDTKSINRLGQWPFSRDVVSKVLYNLSDAGAGIIGFDVVFANQDRLSPHKMAKLLNISGNYANNDKIFAYTLNQTPTILGYFFDMSKKNKDVIPSDLADIKIIGSQSLKHFNHAKGLIDNIDILKQNSYSSGFFNITNIQNGIVDKTPLLMEYNNELYPSLALEMLRIANASKEIIVHNSDLGVIGLQLDNINIPTDKFTQIKLNFRGGAFTYKYISFVDIYTNNFKQVDIQSKFILIGTSDIGLNDKMPTLYDTDMPGVEIHATTIDNILNSDFFYTPIDAYSYGFFALFFTTIIIGSILYFTSPIFSFFIFLSSLFFVIYINYYLIFEKQIIINYSLVIISLFFTTGLNALFSYYYENMHRKKIFSMLSSKVSAEVAKELLKADEDVLSARKQNVSIFFSDIRNFTTLSENINDPQKLINILNKYMQPMVESITEHKGTVDKFIGDAIMAYWNAPIELNNHADLALQSAIDQLKKLKELNVKLNKEFGITLEIGIGINSGGCIVGEMGTKGRSDYTLIGDNVNLASRVESLTKKYNSKIIITEFTKELLKETYTLRKLDTLAVKGRKEKTTIYEVLV